MELDSLDKNQTPVLQIFFGDLDIMTVGTCAAFIVDAGGACKAWTVLPRIEK